MCLLLQLGRVRNKNGANISINLQDGGEGVIHVDVAMRSLISDEFARRK